MQRLVVLRLLKACHNSDSEHLTVSFLPFFCVILYHLSFSVTKDVFKRSPTVVGCLLIWVVLWAWCSYSLFLILFCPSLLSLSLSPRTRVMLFKAITVADVVMCFFICLWFCLVILAVVIVFYFLLYVCGEPSNPSSFCYGTTAVQDDAAPGTQEYIMLRQDSIHSADIRSKGSPFRAKCHEIFCCPLKQAVHKESAEPEGLFAPPPCFDLLMLLVSPHPPPHAHSRLVFPSLSYSVWTDSSPPLQTKFSFIPVPFFREHLVCFCPFLACVCLCTNVCVRAWEPVWVPEHSIRLNA